MYSSWQPCAPLMLSGGGASMTKKKEGRMAPGQISCSATSSEQNPQESLPFRAYILVVTDERENKQTSKALCNSFPVIDLSVFSMIATHIPSWHVMLLPESQELPYPKAFTHVCFCLSMSMFLSLLIHTKVIKSKQNLVW